MEKENKFQELLSILNDVNSKLEGAISLAHDMWISDDENESLWYDVEDMLTNLNDELVEIIDATEQENE